MLIVKNYNVNIIMLLGLHQMVLVVARNCIGHRSSQGLISFQASSLSSSSSSSFVAVESRVAFVPSSPHDGVAPLFL